MSFRKERVGEALRQEISLMLMKGEVKDPRLESVSITGVDVSGDLQTAKVWFVVLGAPGEEKIKSCQDAFKQASGFIRSRLGKKVRLRQLPTLQFRYDPSLDQGARMDKLFASLKNEDGET